MITLDLRKRTISLDEILDAVDQDTVIIVRPDGKRLVLEPEDSFAQEVALLGQSEKFMAFLTERAQEQGGISLEEFERKRDEVEQQTNASDAQPAHE
ncbi:MAG: hypothetical protein WCF99_04430 [Chloroflexales bacterium]